MYQAGVGVPKDEAQAVKYFHEAAKKGFAAGQYKLGLAIVLGQGVQQDYPTAIAWFKLAAKQRLPDAQYYLGVMYQRGWGVPANRVEAIGWYLCPRIRASRPQSKPSVTWACHSDRETKSPSRPRLRVARIRRAPGSSE